MNDLSINRLSLLAAAINAEHRAAFGAAAKAIEHAAECGRHLIEAKALLPHGDWLPWLEANTEVGPAPVSKIHAACEPLGAGLSQKRTRWFAFGTQ